MTLNELEKIREEFIIFLDWWGKLSKTHTQTKLAKDIKNHGITDFGNSMITKTKNRDGKPSVVLGTVYSYLKNTYPKYFEEVAIKH